jgi:hypothetical protein
VESCENAPEDISDSRKMKLGLQIYVFIMPAAKELYKI